jgi:hypothetical protein
MESLKALDGKPPAAIIIDLTRLPSHGREVALALRQRKSTRHIPLVFAEGDPAKVKKIRELLPDATFTTWGRMRGALRHAIAHPPAAPVVPASVLAGYSGTPLPKKLGIKPGMTVALVDAPRGFYMEGLPEGARLVEDGLEQATLAIWFLRSVADLHREISRMRAWSVRGPLWMVWPKKTSRLAGDLSEREVREMGMDAGLVDYKVCAVDETWSGLLFRLRK